MRLFNSILLAAAFGQKENCFDRIDNCQSLKEQGRCSVLNIKTVQGKARQFAHKSDLFSKLFLGISLNFNPLMNVLYFARDIKIILSQTQCRQTCGDCPNGANYSDRCYRDSPCNEKGTAGGNAEGCSSIDRAPFFKCKCKKYFSGTNCATFNCPCKNGGQCAQCYADDVRLCS